MRSAIVEKGLVVNVIIGSIDGSIECSETVGIGWSFDGQAFSPPVLPEQSVEEAREQRVSLLTAICAAKIIGGFQSDALGEQHTYPSDMKDQINLMGSVTDSIMPGLPADWQTPFWCRDEAGTWGWKMHNASQIQQAGRDGKLHVVTCQTTLATLSAQIDAAKTVAAVNAINWPD